MLCYMRAKFTVQIALILLTAAYGCAGSPVRPEPSPVAVAVKPAGVRPAMIDLQGEVVKAAVLSVGVSCPEDSAAPAGVNCTLYLPNLYHKATGVRLPSTMEGLVKAGLPVTKENLRPGDIVYFMAEGKAPVDSGIFIGLGNFILAPASGGPVGIYRLDHDYWRIRFLGARRVLRGAEES